MYRKNDWYKLPLLLLLALGVSLPLSAQDDKKKEKVKELEESAAYVGVVNELEMTASEETQTLSTSVIFSNDIFLKKSGFQFSQFRHRNRGYDSRYEQKYINGVNFNEQMRSQFNYASIGALNDVTRNGNAINYLGASDFAFGDIGGSENIDMRPSSFRRGAKLTLTGTNRNYYFRGMGSYHTGLLDNGWAFSFLLGGRYAHEGIVEGTSYKNMSLFLGVEKQWDKGRHGLSLVGFVSPVLRGQQAAVEYQPIQLTGNYLYNPNWGWQNGKKRNARMVNSWDPTVIVSYDWNPDSETSWTNGFAVHYNRYGRSGLNWYNGEDPRPDYYRYLPNYIKGSPEAQEYTASLWRSGKIAQINWDKLYQVNANNNKFGNGSAIYMIEERRSDLLEFAYNSTFNKQWDPNIKLTAGFGYKHSISYQFKTVEDLLGAEYLLDIDKFAEQDYPGNQDIIQNDLLNPNRRLKSGADGAFGYSYRQKIHTADIWLQQEHTARYLDFYYGARLGVNTTQRVGYMKNGRYPDNSYGEGERHMFLTYDLKLGANYKLNGHHFFTFNASMQARPPLAYDMYIDPQITDAVAPTVSTTKNLSADVNYIFSMPSLVGRVSLFHTYIWDDMDKFSYYHDTQRTFMHHTLYGIQRVHRGVEVGINWAATSALNFDLIGTLAQYYYTNNPMGVLNASNGSKTNQQEEVYMKNLYVGGVPQAVGTIGVNYFINYWFLSAHLNGFAMNHINPSTRRRLPSFLPEKNKELSEKGEKLITSDEYLKMVKQERFPAGYTIDLSVGKIIYLPGKQQININASVQNLLNRRDIRIGGYEQGRIDTLENFGNKHFYMQGINMFLNVGYLF